jgi:hypothetical protein
MITNYTVGRPAAESPPAHLTRREAAIWAAAEAARQRGNCIAYWRMRRALLFCQAERYAEKGMETTVVLEDGSPCLAPEGGTACPSTRSP